MQPIDCCCCASQPIKNGLVKGIEQDRVVCHDIKHQQIAVFSQDLCLCLYRVCFLQSRRERKKEKEKLIGRRTLSDIYLDEQKRLRCEMTVAWTFWF